jgi:polysaccharide biosynthesis protein PslH
MTKILHLIPYYDFYPPQNGGALRCYYINQELSKYFDVTLLTYQDKRTLYSNNLYTWNNDIKVFNPEKNINTKGVINRIINAIKYRFYTRSFSGPAELFLLSFYSVLQNVLKKTEFDYVIFEHLSSMSTSSVIRRISPKTLQIIDQHNVDYLIQEQDNYQNKNKSELLKYKESNLFKKVDYFFCCSDNDKNILEKINKFKIKGHVVPNGTNIVNVSNFNNTQTNVSMIFCGSLDYKPNIEGLFWFYNEIFPIIKKEIPNIKFNIIGRGNSDGLTLLKIDPGINFIGKVDSVIPYYKQSTIAIVPLLTGSGTRLKVLEAMGLGIPVVSTTKGAEGLNYTNNVNVLIGNDPESFANCVVDLMKNKEKRELLASNARRLIETLYSWNRIGYDLYEQIQSLM